MVKKFLEHLRADFFFEQEARRKSDYMDRIASVCLPTNVIMDWTGVAHVLWFSFAEVAMFLAKPNNFLVCLPVLGSCISLLASILFGNADLPWKAERLLLEVSLVLFGKSLNAKAELIDNEPVVFPRCINRYRSEYFSERRGI